MPITFPCRHCGHPNTTDSNKAGEPITCAKCGKSNEVPEAGTPADRAARAPGARTAPRSIRFVCNGCGTRDTVGEEWAGRTFACRTCGKSLNFPAVWPSRAAPFPAAAANAPGTQAAMTARAAPNAKPAPVRMQGDIERPRLDTSQIDRSDLEVSDETTVEHPLPRLVYEPTAEEREAKLRSRVEGKTKKKRKKKSTSIGLTSREAVKVIVFSLAAIAFLWLEAWAHPPLRPMVGASFLGLGALLAFVGNWEFSHAAAEEGYHHQMACRLVPLYKYYYLYTRWKKVREHIVFYLIGLTMLGPGYYLLKTAPPVSVEKKRKPDPWRDQAEAAANSKNRRGLTGK